MQEHITAHTRTTSPFSTNNTGSFSAEAGPLPLGGACVAGSALGFGSGLDSSQTSVLRPSNSILLDPRSIKVKRARFSTLTSARLHQLERPNWAATFIGFTYAPGKNYGPRDISNMVKCLRSWCERKAIECRYLWVAEMQKRGVIHYHMIVFHPKKLSFPKPDKQGWWPHGSTSRSTGIKHAVAYMAKYLSKGDAASFPKGARTYGSGGLQGTSKLEMRWWKLPSWAREKGAAEDGLKRSKGGVLNPTTGELFLSPWIVSFKGGGVYISRR